MVDRHGANRLVPVVANSYTNALWYDKAAGCITWPVALFPSVALAGIALSCAGAPTRMAESVTLP